MARRSGIMVDVVVYRFPFLTVDGILKIIQALRLRPASHWGWALHSGIVTLLLVAVMFGGPPEKFWARGPPAGIDPIFGGLSIVTASLLARVALQEGRPYSMGDACCRN
jgi:uncharacterized membrane protein HdeD (DUF308 family)